MTDNETTNHIVLARKHDDTRAYALLCDAPHARWHEFSALAMNGRSCGCVADGVERATEILEASYGPLRQIIDLGPLPNENRFVCDQ